MAKETISDIRLKLAKMAETVCLAHRYLRFVLQEPVIDQSVNDVIDLNTHKILADCNLTDSPVFQMVSHQAEDYSDEVKEVALMFKRNGAAVQPTDFVKI